MSASSATITERHNRRQGPPSADELVSLSEAATILSETTGCRISYADLYSRFLQRKREQVPIKMHSVERGRTRRGRPVPTKCIKRSDLPALAAWLGFQIDDDGSSQVGKLASSKSTARPVGDPQGGTRR